MLNFSSSTHDLVKVLEVSGRLEPMGGKELRDHIESLVPDSDTSSLLVDLSGLTYMASAGFRELFMAGRKLSRRGAKLAVCSLTGEVKRVFELAKFDTAYPVYSSREEALAAMA